MLRFRAAICLTSCLYTVAVYGADEGVQRRAADGLVSYANVFQWLFGLLIVLALFGVCVWLLHKTGSLSSQSKSQLAVLSGISLGMREKLVLVKVGEKQLLLGVTPGRVDKLMELEGEARLYQNSSVQNDTQSFAKKLQQVLQNKSDV